MKPEIKRRVTVIGMGMSPADLTAFQREAIQKADVLVGGHRHLAEFEARIAALWCWLPAIPSIME